MDGKTSARIRQRASVLLLRQAKGGVTYYNLMGMEVKKPVHGVYIVKRGNKMTKVYLK